MYRSFPVRGYIFGRRFLRFHPYPHGPIMFITAPIVASYRLRCSEKFLYSMIQAPYIRRNRLAVLPELEEQFII